LRPLQLFPIASYEASASNTFANTQQIDMNVKVPKTLPPYVETPDIHRIVEWIKNRKTYRNTIDADLTLVMMAMKTGVRRGELGNLKVKDVNLDKQRIYVRGGKGDKDRVIPIHPDLVDGLSRLIERKAAEVSAPLVSSHGVLPISLGIGRRKPA